MPLHTANSSPPAREAGSRWQEIQITHSPRKLLSCLLVILIGSLEAVGANDGTPLSIFPSLTVHAQGSHVVFGTLRLDGEYTLRAPLSKISQLPKWNPFDGVSCPLSIDQALKRGKHRIDSALSESILQDNPFACLTPLVVFTSDGKLITGHYVYVVGGPLGPKEKLPADIVATGPPVTAFVIVFLDGTCCEIVPANGEPSRDEADPFRSNGN